jgi:predicted transglutaminase-like cysteine proteinase
MPCNLALGRGLRRSILVGAVIACLPGAWPAIAPRSPDLSPSRTVAVRFPDLSPAAVVALRFPDLPPQSLPPAEVVALRFPDLSPPALPPAEIVALRFPDLPPPALPLAEIALLRYPEASTITVPSIAKSAPVASPPPASLVHLIDFQVAAALPPIGLSRFCLRYPDDCKVHEIDFRHRNIALTPTRWNELNIVNRRVNSGIFAAVTPGDGATEEWVISPPSGDCKDYAVTKRHQLLARGWPSRALLLSEVVVPSGEHHLVLLVSTKDADLVLDNLNDEIRPVAKTYSQYVWTGIQSPQNPKFWVRVRGRDTVHTAMLAH